MKSVRRSVAGLAAAALTATGLSVLSLANAPAAHADEVAVDDATFVWGLSGYAQKGIFGPWSYKDLTGNVAQLTGSVSGGTQTTYAVDPVPATSMPGTPAGATPNAIAFSEGTGTADPDTGATSVSWTGSYTVNAYPAQFNAPNEIYSDPELTLDADGNGELTMEFGLGAGTDMEGNPTEAVDLGRVPLMTFSEGAVESTGDASFRATPDYQGVEVTIPAEEGSAQNRTCTPDGGATGWWGSWPAEFVTLVPASVRPHFYSTGCGGMQDFKPALPIDVDLGIEAAPAQAEVTVSETTLSADGSHTVTVTGTGFDPALATGTRPPLSGKPSGTYVVFGKFAENWQPSAAAPSSSRRNSSQKWAVLAEDMATIGGPNAGAVELDPDGSFEATVTVSKAAIDAIATDPSLVNYGIYTYPGGGATQPLYETYTPITFTTVASTVTASVLTTPTTTKTGTARLDVVPSGDVVATGAVSAQVRNASGTVVATLPGTLDETGSAAITLPKLAPGKHTIAASYAGDSNVSSSAGTTSFTVAKVAAKWNSTWTRVPTAIRAGGIRIRVTGAGVGAGTGTVTVQVKNAAGTVVRTVKVKLDSTGLVKVPLPKLRAGKYAVVASYPGNASITSGRYVVRFTAARR